MVDSRLIWMDNLWISAFFRIQIPIYLDQITKQIHAWYNSCFIRTWLRWPRKQPKHLCLSYFHSMCQCERRFNVFDVCNKLYFHSIYLNDEADPLHLAILIVQTKALIRNSLAAINCFGSRWKAIKKCFSVESKWSKLSHRFMFGFLAYSMPEAEKTFKQKQQ